MKRAKVGVVFLLLMFFTYSMSYGQGARYTGTYTKSTAVQYVEKKNIVIEGLEISDSPTANLIALYNCDNVIIRNNKLGSATTKRAILLDNCRNITILDNTFENIHTALIAHNSRTVVFNHNDVTNVGGPLTSDDSNNGFVVLFDRVSGSGNSVSYNVSENIFGQSKPGDLININQSHGIRPAPRSWSPGPSASGGGIILGDIGGSYQIAEDNILVDPGQYGISIAGGNNMMLRNNKVYAKQNYFTNVAIVGCNWYEQLGKSFNITIANNVVNYTNKNGYSRHSWWIYQNVEPVIGKETNRDDPTMTAAILPAKIIGRARGSGTVIGDGAPGTPSGQLPRVYLDKFNRVCANYNGSTYYLDSVTVSQDGKVIVEQILNGYHTVVNHQFTPGEYDILVEYDGKILNTKLVIK